MYDLLIGFINYLKFNKLWASTICLKTRIGIMEITETATSMITKGMAYGHFIQGATIEIR